MMTRPKAVLFVAGLLAGAWGLMGQTAAEHESHHPDAPASVPSPGMAKSASSKGKAMGAEMEGMMRQMLNPPPKELYPTLMSLPELSAKKRTEIEREAHARMTSGTKQMSLGLTRMPQLVERKDYKALQSATEQMRQGLAQFESGLAAHRALADGKAPKDIALEWFRTTMSLPTPESLENATLASSTPPWFHPAIMTLLVGFAVLMVGMYFFKMHRATTLVAALSGATGPAAVASSVAVPNPVSPTAAPIVPSGPLPGSWSGKLRVARIFQETPDVKTFRLAGPSEAAFPFTFEPGQFVAISVPVEGKTVKRSYSIASSPCCHGWCDITVKHSTGGVVSGYLHDNVKEGDLLDAAGPWGRFTFRGQEAPSVVFVAGGVGITPLMSSIRYLTDQSWPGRIDLLYACSSANNIIFREELEYLRRHPNLHVTFVLSKEESPSWTGPRGHITKELLQELVPDLTSRRIHLCGPPPMMSALQEQLAALGVAAKQIHTELFISPEIGAPSKAAPIGSVTYDCAFARSNKTAASQPGQTVLETAEQSGVHIDYSCRQGFCGVCKVKLLEGSVSMAVEDGLAPEEKAAGLVLACQAIQQSNVRIDA